MWEFISNIPQAWLALIGALAGGTGLKLVEFILTRESETDKQLRDMRNEIRADLESCKAETVRLRTEADKWRERYYELMEDSLDINRGTMKPSLREIDKPRDTR